MYQVYYSTEGNRLLKERAKDHREREKKVKERAMKGETEIYRFSGKRG